MGYVALALLIVAVIFFLLASIGVAIPSRLNLVAGGLFFGTLGILLERLP